VAIAPRGVFGGDEYDVSYVLYNFVDNYVGPRHHVASSSDNYVVSGSSNYVGPKHHVASSSDNCVGPSNSKQHDNYVGPKQHVASSFNNLAMPSVRQHGAGEQVHVHVCVQEYDVWPALCSETKTVAGSSGRGPILPVSSTAAAH